MLKKLKLAPKLALTIGSVLTVILVILIAITISLSKAAISTATYGELMAMRRKRLWQICRAICSGRTIPQKLRIRHRSQSQLTLRRLRSARARFTTQYSILSLMTSSFICVKPLVQAQYPARI